MQPQQNSTPPKPIEQPAVAAPFAVPAFNAVPPSAANDTIKSTSSVQISSAPDVANDGDLIEKDWVHKAKQVVSLTADDPYEQSRQLGILKADYLNKRYGKIIKAKE